MQAYIESLYLWNCL